MSERRVNRLVDNPKGRGSVYDGDCHVADVTYNIEKRQDVTILSTSEEVKGYGTILGTISAPSAHDLMGKKLVLHMSDGRRFDFIAKRMISLESVFVTGTDFYRAE